jgi:dihydrolipoamide dehydrogenase
MLFSKDGVKDTAEAELAVMAVGWQANTTRLNLEIAGVELDTRGFIKTNSYLQTSTPHIYAAGDITGRLMLVPQAIKDGFIAGTNAVHGNSMEFENQVSPIGSFTDPEYAQVGLTESKARENHDITTAVIRFDTVTRNIIDGRTNGFCKLIVDRKTCKILGCHVVGERAVEIVQTAAIAMTASMRVDDLAQIPFSFPAYTAVLGRASAMAARELNLQMKWQPHFTIQ